MSENLSAGPVLNVLPFCASPCGFCSERIQSERGLNINININIARIAIAIGCLHVELAIQAYYVPVMSFLSLPINMWLLQ